MVDVIPGILEHDFPSIEEKLNIVESLVDWVQIDIVDDLFHNNNFRDPIPFKGLQTQVSLELHMMIHNPETTVKNWVDAGFSRFIGHVEGIKDIDRFINTVRSFDKEVGLALDIVTPTDRIEEYLNRIDQVLIMSIHTGKSGQSFMPKTLEKIKRIRKIDTKIPIEVDGGVNQETGKQAVEAGATRLVSTSYIFKSENIPESIKSLEGV